MNRIIIRMYLLSLFSSLIPVQAMDEASMVVERADSKKRSFREFSYHPLRRASVDHQAPHAKKAKTGEWCDIEVEANYFPHLLSSSLTEDDLCEVEDEMMESPTNFSMEGKDETMGRSTDFSMEEEVNFGHFHIPTRTNSGPVNPFVHTKNTMLFPYEGYFGGVRNRMGCVYPPMW